VTESPGAAPDTDTDTAFDHASRVEAAEAGLHAEAAEAADGGGVADRHVTATDVAGRHPHRHHPDDPNVGVVRMRLGRGAVVAGVVAGALMLAALIVLGVAVGGA
jgi:transcriptional regulator GlxA family with amidase domain